jgi:lipopolysaccharide export system permease protein
MRPLLGAAAIVAAVSFLFGDQILPRTNHRLKSLMTSIQRTKPTFSLKEHVINEVKRGKLALRAGRIDQSTYRMRDVTIYSLEAAQKKRVIYADSGYVSFAPNQEDLHLTLYDGAIHDYDSDDPQVFQQTRFERQIVIVPDVGAEFLRREESMRSDREMGVCELDKEMRESRQQFEVNVRRADAKEHNTLRSLVGLPPIPQDTVTPQRRPSVYCRALALAGGLFSSAPLEAAEVQEEQAETTAGPDRAEPATRLITPRVRPMRPTEVRIFRDRARSAQIRSANYAVEYHKKYAIPAACIVFVLVGVPLALRFPRGGLGLVLGAGMIVFAVYYIGLIAGESLANRLIVSPFLSMWATNLLMGAIGVIGLIDLRRSGTVPRRIRKRRVAEGRA